MSEQEKQRMPSSGSQGSNVADTRVSLNLSPREAVEFIQKLACDDEFRARLQKSPRDTLAEFHIGVPADLIPAQITLPSKEELGRVITATTLGTEFQVQVPAAAVFIVFLAFFAFFKK